MRLACLVLAIVAAAPLAAGGQPADSGRAVPSRTVFSIQPLFEGREGPRFELERAIGNRIALTAGSRLTMSDADFIERFPRFSQFDVGVRYYAASQPFRGPFAGVYTGYDRNISGPSADRPHQVERYFLGGTIGYDVVAWRRLLIAPAVGAEFGRPSPATGIKAWEVHPRLGIGFNFD